MEIIKIIHKMAGLLVFAFIIMVATAAEISVSNLDIPAVQALDAGFCSSSFPTKTVPLNGTMFFNSMFDNVDCGWKFFTDTGFFLSIDCTQIDIKPDEFLYIKDRSENVIESITDIKLASYSKSFDSNFVEIGMKTDGSPRDPGFQCTIRSDPISSTRVKSGCTCGENEAGRIVGGVQAAAHEFKFMAALKKTKEAKYQFCGGSILNREYILTSAQCAIVIEHPYISLGAHDITQDSGYTTVQAVKRFIHRSFNAETLDYDIALYQVPTITFTANVGPVCLPDVPVPTDEYVGDIATVIGWGETAKDGPFSEFLMKVELLVLSDDECLNRLGSNLYTDRMICAGSNTEEKYACEGDAGGPMFVNDGRAWEQIGIVSRNGCASENLPGLFTRVTAMLPWISEHAGIMCARPSNK